MAEKRKGFMYIVEIIIISVVLLVIVSIFFSIPRPSADWQKAKLSILAGDVLFSLEKAGVDWFDSQQVEENLSKILGEANIFYSVTVKGGIKPYIVVGCICTNAEKVYLENVLSPFTLNGRDIKFSVEKIDPGNIRFPLRDDVVVLFDYNLPDEQDVMSYLSEGKGIVEVRDLSQTEIDNYPVQKNAFGLYWEDSFSPSGGSVKFSDRTGSPEHRFYRIYKYFHGLQKELGGYFSEPHTFGGLLSGEKVNSTDSEERIILREKSTGVPALIANENMADGNGRTAWLSADSGEEDIRHLLKSLVIWAAGDVYYPARNLESQRTATIGKASIFKVINKDFYEAVEITLTLGLPF